MARQIIWLPAALDDLREIVGYIASRSDTFGSVVATTIFSKVERLAEMPFIGAVIREDDAGMHRHLICYTYRIIYRVIEDRIYIVAVIHGARLLPDDLLSR